MITVVCWLWKPTKNYRSQFTVENVNVLFRMVSRCYPHPFQFTCITDQTEGFDPRVRIIPLWDEFKDLQSVYGPDTPTCFRRLKAFDPEIRYLLGNRFVSVDLDCVAVDDLTPVWSREEDFLIWGATARRTPFNGSMWLMTAGARAKVYTEFARDPKKAILKAQGAGFYGSDQAWMNYILGRRENHWNEADGVFSYRQHIKKEGGKMPKGARIIFFEGHYDPWHPHIQEQCPWVKNYYL